MQNLLNSLLSYSRVTTKAEPMKKTDLRRSVKEALSNLEILIEREECPLGGWRLPDRESGPGPDDSAFSEPDRKCPEIRPGGRGAPRQNPRR